MFLVLVSCFKILKKAKHTLNTLLSVQTAISNILSNSTLKLAKERLHSARRWY